jgi:DNA-binding transcriptional MerR regulator
VTAAAASCRDAAAGSRRPPPASVAEHECCLRGGDHAPGALAVEAASREHSVPGRRRVPSPGAAGRAPAGYRDYDSALLDRIAFVRHAEAAGLALAAIRQVLAIRDGGQPACRHVTDLITRRLAEMDARLAELTRTRDQLVGSRSGWPGRTRPTAAATARSAPAFRQPDEGAVGARHYMHANFTAEEGLTCSFNEPIVGESRRRSRVVGIMDRGGQGPDDGRRHTPLLRRRGLVLDQRDYWNDVDGRREPYPGW